MPTFENKDYIKSDYAYQVNVDCFLNEFLCRKSTLEIFNYLDFGCGDGCSYNFLNNLIKKGTWNGLEIIMHENLPKSLISRLKIYDGKLIPYESENFDLIYAKQVLEHVENPHIIFSELSRILKPNGYFIGSVSQMEPYHGYGVFNYTPRSLELLATNASLELLEVRPSIDSITLILRAIFNKKKFFNKYWNKESPLNRIISIIGWIKNSDKKKINYIKTLYAGQICFLMKKK